MKKLFTKLAIILIANSAIMPLVACSFNFYVNSATNAISKSFAHQTSALIKAMIMSKTLGSDTKDTINDIMSLTKNNSIKNLNPQTKFANWNQLAQQWGDNGTIEVKGFDANQYFIVANKNDNTINHKKQLNDTLAMYSQIRLLTSIPNSSLSKIIFDTNSTIPSSIIDYLNKLVKLVKWMSGKPKENSKIENDLKNLKEHIKLIENGIGAGILWGNSWKDSEGQLKQELKTYFEKLKENIKSQELKKLIENEIKILTSSNFDFKKLEESDLKKLKENIMWLEFDLWPQSLRLVVNLITKYDSNFLRPLISLINNLVNDSKHTTPKNDAQLTAFMMDRKDDDYQEYSGDNGDYNLYRTGILINYLFWKISKDQSILGSDKKTIRYLSDIIYDHISWLKFDFDIIGFLEDIKRYIRFLLSDPLYPLLIIQAMVPIIKKYIWEMSDIRLGIKNLTIGHDFPTNKTENSYNLLDILNTIKNLLNNPTQLKIILQQLLDMSGLFIYDIKIKNKKLKFLFEKYFNEKSWNDLIEKIIPHISSPENKNIIDNAINMLTKYTSNNAIDINLLQLQTFLSNLLEILANTIDNLKKIIERGNIPTEEDIKILYRSIGGRIIPDADIDNFVPGSLLATLKPAMIKQDHIFYKILNFIIGTNDNSKLGITGTIINDNNQWINDNYRVYYDDNVKGVNKPITSISNITFLKKTIKNNETINLTYDLSYQIKNKTYHFAIHVTNNEDLNTFTGIRTFKFKSITLKNIK